VSKFRIIDGSNVSSIAGQSREIQLLEMKADKRDLTDQEIVVLAHHFVRLGQPILAQKHLNRLSSGYFDIMVYKDLFKALLAWSFIQTVKIPEMGQIHTHYEYYLIVKQGLENFEDLSFTEKPAFYRFRHEFYKIGETLLESKS
jgi:hypothetical protein